MLTISASKLDRLNVGISAYLTISDVSSSTNYAQWWLRRYDPIAVLMQSHNYFYGPLEFTVDGFFGSESIIETTYVNYKPKTYPYHMSGRYDEGAYASIISNVGLFIDTLTGISPSKDSPSLTDKFTRHFSYEGDVMKGMHVIDSAIFHNNFYGISFDSSYTQGLLGLSVVVDQLSPTRVHVPTTVNSTANYNVKNLFDLLSKGVSLVNPFPEFGLESCVYHIHDFSYSFSVFGFDISYGIDIDYKRFNESFNRKAHISGIHIHSSGLTSLPKNPTLHSSYSYLPMGSSTYSWKEWWSSDGPIAGPISGSVSGGSEYLLFTAYSDSALPQSSDDAFSISSHIRSCQILESFETSVNSDMINIVPSSFLSSSAAASDLHSHIDDLYYRSVAKVLKLSSDLENIFLKFRPELLSLDKLSSKIHFDSLMNLLVSSSLSHSDFLLLKELVTTWAIDVAAAKYSIVLNGKVSGHGSYQFTFPTGTFGRVKTDLITRTTIVMRVGTPYLLSSLIGIDVSDFLFQFTSARSEIPFYRMIEGFLGISAAYKSCIQGIFLSPIPASYVHSYTLSSELSAQELTTLNVVSTNGTLPTLRVYNRDVSFYYPFPRASKYNFGMSIPSTDSIATTLLRLVLGNVQSHL